MRGHIAKKGTRYYAVIYEGIDPTTGKGRHRWHSAGSTREEAERLLADLVKRHHDGDYRPPEKITLAVPWRVEAADETTFEKARLIESMYPQLNVAVLPGCEQDPMIDLAVGRLAPDEAVTWGDGCVTAGSPTLDEVLPFSDIRQITVDHHRIDASRGRKVFHSESAEGTGSVGIEGCCGGLCGPVLWHELDEFAGRIPVGFDSHCPSKRNVEEVELAYYAFEDSYGLRQMTGPSALCGAQTR